MLLKEYLHVILNAMALGPDSSFHNTLSICVHNNNIIHAAATVFTLK